jgi:hypothetical protein
MKLINFPPFIQARKQLEDTGQRATGKSREKRTLTTTRKNTTLVKKD